MLELFTSAEGLPPAAGFVPTMGTLHQGHLSLIEHSLKENRQTVVSIFVNPKQFGPQEDFHSYPRTLEEDMDKLKSLGGDIALFAPDDPEKVFPAGFATSIEPPPALLERLCAPLRPEHFAGVATVIYALFKLTRPRIAYFGQKDYQQFKVIEAITRDLRLPVELKMLPIVRTVDGLALSSRNSYLSEKERQKALILNRTINQVAANPRQSLPSLEADWEYLEVLDADTLGPLEENSSQALVAGALQLGSTRLIDNAIITLC